MAKSQRKQKKPVEKPAQLFQPKDFLDLIAPAAVKFNTDSYVLGGLYRCVLALRGYPAATEELALLSHICNRAGVTLHLYARQVTAAEEDAIYHKAVNKNRLDRSNQDNLKRSVTAEANLQDVAAIIAGARKNREPLIHCAVFLELASKSPEELRRLREELGLDTVALDLDFLRRYRNSPRVLNYILNDLWSLRMRLRVCVPPGEPLRGLREELEPLRERFLRPGGELEVIVPAAPGEEERARTLAEALSAFRLPVRVTGAEHRPEANALYGSGYMPGYLLHTMASSRGSRMPRLTLLDGDSGVALLTPEGLKRPVYHLLSLLEQLGDTVIAQGDMYLAARQSGREDIQVLLYHYDACFDTLFEGGSRVEEQAPFVELMKDHDYNREVTLSVRGMTGRFAIRKYRLTSEEYASRYRDFPLPLADRLSAETLRVLNGTLAPEMSLNLLELDGAYHLTLKLAPFEILLLCFEKL